MNNLGVKARLVAGFSVIIAVMFVITMVMNCQIARTSDVTTRTIELRAPTIQNSIQMLNAMNLSLAGLRGWILLGDERFIEDRATAWRNIDSAIGEMDRLSVDWTNPENALRLVSIKEHLASFRDHQREIEAIAQTPENTPATKLLLDEATPRAELIITGITAMIDIEKGMSSAASERRALLGYMADFRGAMAMALADLRAYLLSGKPEYREGFDAHWQKLGRSHRLLKKSSSLLTKEQRLRFNNLEKALEEFRPLPEQMFEIRDGDGWNMANLWLGTRAAPVGEEIVTLVRAMVDSQAELMANDKRMTQESFSALQYISWGLLTFGMLLAGLFSVITTRAIVRPVNALTAAATNISLGRQIEEPLTIEASGELGQLVLAMERLRVSVVLLMQEGDDDDLDDI